MISLSLRLNKRRLSLCLLTAAAIVGAAAAAVGFFGKATAASSTVALETGNSSTSPSRPISRKNALTFSMDTFFLRTLQ